MAVNSRVPDARRVVAHLVGAVERVRHEGVLLGGYEVVARRDRESFVVELDDAEGLTVALYAGVFGQVAP